MFETAMAYGQIIIADLILSGDNALIIGMAAAGLSPKLRKRAILYGMVIAAVLRIVFACDCHNPSGYSRHFVCRLCPTFLGVLAPVSRNSR
jgi:hypothetical protein